MIDKKYLLAGGIASALLLGACSSVSADTDLDWKADGKEGTAEVTSEQTETAEVEHNAQKAVEEVKKNFDGKVTEVELDEDDGVHYYEIEMENGKEEYEVEINAETLEILEEDFDSDDGKEGQDDAGSGMISSEEAVEIAEKETGGKAVEWDFDDDDAEYEVELDADGEEVEVELDAKTGDIIETDD
ncbi:MAG TPA: PepSY domain-containing protein [Candidatus Salinicoccus stercoripullorum]|uniref:PepSY domain-containing protein n=1 Tax=Candidatus Salinicoccus stercoripullorum TaxID=2838756 RepID=A0A9D1U0R8_9STAP|nr:PepSY domain-containing protein [Candidatus Salinicoccus stercoripullorum]